VTTPRIVSLLPSTTEIVAALGMLDSLLAVTFECDYPDGVRTGRGIAVDTPMPHGLSPAAIDSFVRERMSAGLPMYELKTDVVKDLAPDVVLTQDLCQVCALPAGQVEEALGRLGCAAHVVTFDPHSVEDVLDGIVTIGSAISATAAANELVASLRDRRQVVRDSVIGRKRPQVLVLEWTDPPFIAGHWVPELITTAGGDALLAMPGERSTTVTWDAAQDSNPDIVLVAPCGFGVIESVGQAAEVAERFPNAKVWAIDGNAYVTRPGPRLIDAIEALALAFHHDRETPGVTARVQKSNGRKTLYRPKIDPRIEPRSGPDCCCWR
jgi:iron complex transport system substrate-binding protein